MYSSLSTMNKNFQYFQIHSVLLIVNFFFCNLQNQHIQQDHQQQLQQNHNNQNNQHIQIQTPPAKMPRGKGPDAKPRGRMTAYAFFVQTCREEHKKKHPEETVIFAEFSRKCAERWKVIVLFYCLHFVILRIKDKNDLLKCRVCR